VHLHVCVCNTPFVEFASMANTVLCRMPHATFQLDFFVQSVASPLVRTVPLQSAHENSLCGALSFFFSDPECCVFLLAAHPQRCHPRHWSLLMGALLMGGTTDGVPSPHLTVESTGRGRAGQRQPDVAHVYRTIINRTIIMSMQLCRRESGAPQLLVM
jgi:hypothetical protein